MPPGDHRRASSVRPPGCGSRDGAGTARRANPRKWVRIALHPLPARERTKLAFPTTASAMEALAAWGIAREITGRRRDRLFVYDRYLAILDEGTGTP